MASFMKAPPLSLTPDPPFPASTTGCWRLGGELYHEFGRYERVLTDLLRARAQITPKVQEKLADIEAKGGPGTEAGRKAQLENASLFVKNYRVNDKLAEYGRLRDRLRALSMHMRTKGMVRRGGNDLNTFPLEL
ncbi:hypothetical protein VE01_04391 [Pseudogymnoascus verrucosus]|uniref:Uncharacterized protein n=1 Tax=Pseudogymnoascus verrucosus TaxID=342668 RepID=A0A1B8GNQ6_9PEZI|nr:uncharacterized protein VE01_04391 [Pseudogymnoascus verrucosus]OBT97456.1 hypothetical protein VE01_04391 [Pseudogymnoascus verrucosus]